jgi:hypothetical protein
VGSWVLVNWALVNWGLRAWVVRVRADGTPNLVERGGFPDLGVDACTFRIGRRLVAGQRRPANRAVSQVMGVSRAAARARDFLTRDADVGIYWCRLRGSSGTHLVPAVPAERHVFGVCPTAALADQLVLVRSGLGGAPRASTCLTN